MPFKPYSTILTTLTVLIMIGTGAHAQSRGVDIIPAKSAAAKSMELDEEMETHPPLRLTPDKSELIRLDEEAGSIVVGNPSHLNIMADSAKTLIVVPRIPGASYFTVLNKKGDVIMQRHVIVGSPKQKYVRVRRTCYGDYNVGDGCRPTRTYYCPDICHEVNTEYEQFSSSTNGSASGNTTRNEPQEDLSSNNEEESEE